MATQDRPPNPFNLTEAEMTAAERAFGRDPERYFHDWHHRVNCRVSEARRDRGARQAEIVEIGLRHELAKLRLMLEARGIATRRMAEAHRRLAEANYRAELAGVPRSFLEAIQGVRR